MHRFDGPTVRNAFSQMTARRILCRVLGLVILRRTPGLLKGSCSSIGFSGESMQEVVSLHVAPVSQQVPSHFCLRLNVRKRMSVLSCKF